MDAYDILVDAPEVLVILYDLAHISYMYIKYMVPMNVVRTYSMHMVCIYMQYVLTYVYNVRVDIKV